MGEKLHEIKLRGCTVFLYDSEMRKLLYSHPDVYREGLKRGKAIIRGRKSQERVK